MNQRKEENDRRNHFMINLHESMGPDRDRTRDPWICSQTPICRQTRYRLRYAARRTLLIYNLCSSFHTVWFSFGFLPGILTVAMYCIADLQCSGNTVSINRLPSTVSGVQARYWPAQLTLMVIDL